MLAKCGGSEPSECGPSRDIQDKVASSSEDSCTWEGLRGHKDLGKPMEGRDHVHQEETCCPAWGRHMGCGQGWANMHRPLEDLPSHCPVVPDLGALKDGSVRDKATQRFHGNNLQEGS